MLCEAALQLIDERYDGALEAAQEASLGIHLRGCSSCRKIAAQTDALRKALVALREDTASLTRQPGRAGRSRLRTLSGLAAAIALLITAGVFLTRGDSPPGHVQLTPSATPQVAGSNLGAGEHPRATLVLGSSSAARYIPVERETSRPDVHLFILFQATPAVN